MPTTINKNNFTAENYTFVPVKDVENLLENSINIPYNVKFSLQPYLNSIKARLPKACPNTKMALLPLLKENQSYIESGKTHIEDIAGHEEFQTILSMAIPSLLYDNELSYISSPFKKNFLVKTPAFQSLFNSDDWMLKIDQEMLARGFSKNIQQAGIHILNKLYGQNISNKLDEFLTIFNKKSKVEKHFRINLKFDFIEVTNVKPLPELSKSQINFLLKNFDDIDLWLKHLPVDAFQFSGFTIGSLYDVTDIQVLSNLKNWLHYNKNLKEKQYFEAIGGFIKSYIGKDDVKVGGFILDTDTLYQGANLNVLEKKCFTELIVDKNSKKQRGIFDHLIAAKRVLYIDDLTELEDPSDTEIMLLNKGVKSYLISPLMDEKENIISVLELSSQEANTFNFKNVPKLQPIFEQLALNFENYSNDLSNRVTAIIQKNFTSIHPSVKWKFEEVAKDYYVRKQSGEEGLSMSPIIFKNVYPLYGQSDIVDSSKIRNEAIKTDLIENLIGLKNLLVKWTSQKKLHLLESYKIKVDNLITNLQNEFISTDESRIVKLVTEDIRPVLDQLKHRHPDLSSKAYDKYCDSLDDKLGIIYHKRKDFEHSVTKLNSTISDFMEKDENEMQQVLSHFFEKYKTDGVEYNLYLGQSILQEGEFTHDDLKNFRIWQLVNSCEVTRLVNKTSTTLPLPLKTAELIFVYNNPLSIRFRMDEKKFDVDGAYNVRYEILKKRIDKATIKGTEERLTQSGKVAIVYLSDKDRLEYMEFMEYLKEKNYIQDEVEDLLLDKLQGAEGLRALRITVKHL